MPNDPESQALTLEDITIFENARQEISSLRRTFNSWITIAKAIMRARQIADARGGRKTFLRILEQQSISPALGKSPKTMASKLEKIMEHYDEIIVWRETLTPHQQIIWAAPATIILHCPVFKIERAKNKKDKEPKFKPVQLDTAIESVLYHFNDIDEDNKRAIIERIAGPQREDGDRFKPTDTANDIAIVIVSTFSPSKAESIARAILKKLADRKKKPKIGDEARPV